MPTIKQIKKEDREAIFKEILVALKPLASKFDESILKWALNRHLTERREIEKARKAKAAAEERLKELGAA